jgi:hypothetical protein
MRTFSSNSREFDSAATETPHSGKNISVRRPDPYFLLVIRWHVLRKSYCFRVIRENSIRPQ